MSNPLVPISSGPVTPLHVVGAPVARPSSAAARIPRRPRPSVCGVCGRPLPDQTGQSGRTLMFCRGRGGQPSACAVLDKRMNEALRLAEQLVCDLQDSGAPVDAVSSQMQSVKGYIWSELNGLTNSFGPLRRKKSA